MGSPTPHWVPPISPRSILPPRAPARPPFAPLLRPATPVSVCDLRVMTFLRMSNRDSGATVSQRKLSPHLIPHLRNGIFVIIGFLKGGCAAGHNVGQGDRADKRTSSPDRQRPPSFCHRFYPDPLLPFWTFLAKTRVWGAFPAWASRLRVWRARRGRGRRCGRSVIISTRRHHAVW